MQEYIRVTYDSRRPVYVNGVQVGFTNEILSLDTFGGLSAEVDLGTPRDYEPSHQTISLRNTSSGHPANIAFSPKA